MSRIAFREYIRVPMPDVVNYEGVNYVKQGKGPKIGVMVCLEDQRWGWSMVSPEEDLTVTKTIKTGKNGEHSYLKILPKPSKEVWEMGTFIALDRALGADTPEIIPNIARRSIHRFEDRMRRYFKK